MKTKKGFTKFSVEEFEKWIGSVKIARTVFKIQLHHTYVPSYEHFKINNHFELQDGMKKHHVNQNGWNDIGQHFTIFPDGNILTGRSLEKSPACIYSQNANAICIENLGNFDSGNDEMSLEQKESIIRVTVALCKRFNLNIDTERIVYHHWFDLLSGVRNNGVKNNKTCPGTNFFGGNKVIDCINNFLPLIKEKLSDSDLKNDSSEIEKYVIVTTDFLNIRSEPNYKSKKVKERQAVELGAILRVYLEKEKWYKISNSSEHWINSRYTKEVIRGRIKANILNVRSGPGIDYSSVGRYKKGEEVFITEIKKNWCKISMENKWISKKYIE